ncbi:MAG TPA: hypothetical protein VJZ02_01525 [Candidatus Brocadiales bacterium]|nr:hypothetical protein [Candidatus Brocadiales bacterium]
MPPLTLNFTTIFDPINRRLGEEYLELYPSGKTDCEILAVPIDWYEKGQTRTWSLDLWYARRQEADRVEEVQMYLYTFGADNRLGQEVVANGYLKAKLSTSPGYSLLTTGYSLSLGDFWPNSKKTVDFQFNMPVGALTPVGLNMIGLRLELLRSVVYGSTAWGRAIYGKYEGRLSQSASGGKKDITLRLHVK